MTEIVEKKRKQDDDSCDYEKEMEKNNQTKVLFILNFYPMKFPEHDTHYAVFTSGKDFVYFNRIISWLRADMCRVYNSAYREELGDSTRLWFPFVEFFLLKEDEDEGHRRNCAYQFMMQTGKLESKDLGNTEVAKDFFSKDIGRLQITDSAEEIMRAGEFDNTIVIHPHCNHAKFSLYQKNISKKLDL